MYNIQPLVSISPLESPSSSKCEEGKRFEAGIDVTFQCAKNTLELVQLVFECLRERQFQKKIEVTTRPSATMEEPMLIIYQVKKKTN